MAGDPDQPAGRKLPARRGSRPRLGNDEEEGVKWFDIGVLLRIPGLTDLQYGRIADQLYTARHSAVIGADLDALSNSQDLWIKIF